MEHQFWHNCWQNNTIGFHQSQVHPWLQQHFAALVAKDKAPLNLFVPFCGKSIDMLFLSQYGKVVGAELSDIACRDFFTENQLQPHCQPWSNEHRQYQAGAFTLYQGDFFGLNNIAPDSGFDWIYDRAALIALPESLRRQYVEALKHYLAPQTKLLLISLEFPQHEMSGPPFPVMQTEIMQLFAGFKVELLNRQPMAENRFAQRTFKVSSLVETVYLISAI